MLATAPISSPPALPPIGEDACRGAAYFSRDQEVGDVDEVGEGVLLLEQLAVVVPGAAQLLAAADVRDGVDEAAVEQRDAARVETPGRIEAP